MRLNTLESLPDDILPHQINTLVISWHPGLKTFEEIFQSCILRMINPEKFIFDPGSSRIGEIENHLRDIELFNNQGYVLDKIVVLPYLQHQYCEFSNSSVKDKNTTV